MRYLPKFISIVPVLLLLICFAAAPALAQDLDNVTISGKVTDQNGAVIPGATVTATLVATKLERTVIADGDGNYTIIQLPPGTYVLRAEAKSFQPTALAEESFVAGRNAQIDIVLFPPGIVLDRVVVTTVASPVDTTRTVVGGTVTTREIESLPVATRSPLDLIFTLGGVSEEPLSTRDLAEDRTGARSTPEEAGNFSLSGGPAYSNNITIDGLDNNDDRAARERLNPSLDAIEEVQVIRNQFAAEYGRASGGRINLRTRGGSNKFHGRAYYYFRNDVFNANTFNNKRLGRISPAAK